MKCPNCEINNPDDRKFCYECGSMLLKICPQCDRENLPRDKFCGECGQNLDEKVEVKEKASTIISERKHITILFSDMAGYTAMTERLDPEEVKEIMSRIFGEIARVVAKYEGFIERFIGDAVMALFGVPKVHEDDAVRAIRAAREIHALVEATSPRLEAKVGRPLYMHSGINTGLVVTGEVDLEKGTHGMTGDAINLASHLEGLAEAGEILVGEETFRKAEGHFIFERLEPRRVKGKKEAVNIYKIIAPSTRRTRFDVSSERGLTPLVGRERELDLLLDGFERSKRGRGQAYSVMAEAGVGKSRLLYEFRKTIAKEDVTFLEGKCLSYSSSVPYHPIIDILKSNFDIRDDDGDMNIRETVKRGFKVLKVDESSTLPYLLELLSVKDSGIDKISMSPESRKDGIIEAIKRIALKVSEIRPLIIAIEDLHWIDKSSEEALKYMLDSIQGERIFLIMTYRPEFVHTWGGRSYHSQINLNRLSNRESITMVNYLLGTEDIESVLENLILEKAEGVPFFIEEFIKSLKDIKAIEKKDRYQLIKDIHDLAIPSTIQDVIMARVDSLPEGAKEVLQTGSVIEREFSHELIKRVTGLSQDELLSNLSVLKDSELIYERGIYPQSTYIFKHALTREVAYDSILTQKKKRLHEEIGNAIEKVYKDNIADYYGVLAEHYITSENYEKGAEYSKLAARKAQKAASLPEAISYVKKRIASLEGLSQTNEVIKKIIDARTILGINHLSMNCMVEAKEAIDPILDVALQTDYKRRLSLIYTIKGIYEFTVEENMNKAYNHLEESLSISEEIDDIVSSAVINYWMGIFLATNCDFNKAANQLERAININAAVNNLWNVSVMKSSLSFSVYNMQGSNNLAHQTSSDALQIAEESGDIFSKALAFTAHGCSCYGKGLFKEAIEQLLEGVPFYKRVNVVAWDCYTQTFLAETYTEIGEYHKAKEHYGRAIRPLENYGILPSMIHFNKLGAARANVMNGGKNVELRSLIVYASENKIKVNDGLMRRHIGEILLNIDDQHMSEAQHWIESAIEKDKQYGMMWHLGRDYALYAELFKRKGVQSKARENLNKAIEILKECGADGWVEKYEKELASL